MSNVAHVAYDVGLSALGVRLGPPGAKQIRGEPRPAGIHPARARLALDRVSRPGLPQQLHEAHGSPNAV